MKTRFLPVLAMMVISGIALPQTAQQADAAGGDAGIGAAVVWLLMAAVVVMVLVILVQARTIRSLSRELEA